MRKIICLIMLTTATLFIFSNCGEEALGNDSESNQPTVEEPATQEVVIADDEYVTAKFEKMYDATSLGIDGVFYIDIDVKNKTDKEIWVYIDNASVNDEMVPLVASGIPLRVQPDKSGRNGFIFSFSYLSIDKIEDVKEIEFDLVVADNESLEEIERVKSVSLSF